MKMLTFLKPDTRTQTKMRRFLLQGVERQFECTLYSNGCVSINLDPHHYRTHFCSFKEFRAVHDEPITWLDQEVKP